MQSIFLRAVALSLATSAAVPCQTASAARPLAAAQARPAAEPIVGPEVVPLRVEARRKWQIELPAERWARIGESIELGPDRFVTKPEGVGLAIDTDGDGATDVVVRGETGFVTLRGEGDRELPVRLRNQGAGWAWSTGAVAVGKFGETRVQLVDQDGNGRFGDFGVDAIAIGRSAVATYLSRAVSVGGELFSLDVDPDGTELTLAPFTGEAGTLDLSSGLETSGKLIAAVVRSSDGAWSFDLAAGPQRVPVGAYRLERGVLGLGENRVEVAAGNAKALRVTAGETTTWTWGGPLRAEFEFDVADGEVRLAPDRVWYFGSAGEQYRSFTPVGKSPEFVVTAGETVLATVTFPGSC